MAISSCVAGTVSTYRRTLPYPRPSPLRNPPAILSPRSCPLNRIPNLFLPFFRFLFFPQFQTCYVPGVSRAEDAVSATGTRNSHSIAISPPADADGPAIVSGPISLPDFQSIASPLSAVGSLCSQPYRYSRVLDLPVGTI